MSALSRTTDWLIVPLCVVALAWEPNFAHGFLNYNESGQHLAAMRELARGSALFRDVFAQYGPLHYYVPYWAAGVFGETIATLRGYFLAGEIAGFLAAWALCRVLIPNRIFAVAAVFVFVMEAHHPFWSTRWGGFRFAFVYLALLGLLLALLKRQPGWLFAAGASAGLALLHTYDAGAVALLAVAGYLAFAYATRADVRAWARELGWVASGSALVLLPFLFQLWVSGTFFDYVAQLPLANAGRAWIQPISPALVTPTVIAPGIVYLFAIGFGVRGLRASGKDRRRSAGLLLVSATGLLLYVGAFRAIRGPQFETSLPLAVIALFYLLSHAYAVLERGLDDAGSRLQAGFGFAVLLVAMLAISLGEIRAYQGGLARFLAHQSSKQERVARHVGSRPLEGRYRALDLPGAGGARLPLAQAEEIEVITRYLRENTRPDQSLLGYPDLGAFNAFADRPHATRFTIAVLAAADPGWSQELLDVVRKGRAQFVLLGNQLGTLARATGRPQEYLPEFRTIVEANYDHVKHFERLDVYRAPSGRVR